MVKRIERSHPIGFSRLIYSAIWLIIPIMPNGIVHTRATMITTVAVGALSVCLGATPEQSFIISSGALLGTIVSPDNDVDEGFMGFHIVRVLCGDAASILYQLYWRPYALICNHRGIVSHTPIVSTIIRMVYLFAPLLIIVFTLNYEYGRSLLSLLITLFFGLCVSDCVHILLDFVTTSFKRMF